MATITLENLMKIYPGAATPSVDDVSLTVDDGEFVVLVGPSGCGKTTLLRMIAGLEEITAGVLRIGDIVANDVPPQRRDVAMVFQNYALYPHLSVFDNIAFALKQRKVGAAEIRERVVRVARMLDLEPYLERKPRALSGGQRQRVAMGRAIVREPRAFLMDEPLSNLDAKLRVQTRTELKSLQARLRTTTVYVTHDQTEAMTLADRIVVLHDGRVQQVGTPGELYARPENVFVASFIGSPAMNIVHAAATGGGIGLGDLRLAVEGVAGERLLLGIRPEAFVAEPSSTRATVDVVPEVIEHMGNETLVFFRLPGVERYEGVSANIAALEDQAAADGAVSKNLLVARLDPEVHVAVGTRIGLGLDARRVHLFDAETEQRLERTA